MTNRDAVLYNQEAISPRTKLYFPRRSGGEKLYVERLNRQYPFEDELQFDSDKLFRSPIHPTCLTLVPSLEFLLVCTISWSPFISPAEHAAVFSVAARTIIFAVPARLEQRRGEARHVTQRDVT